MPFPSRDDERIRRRARNFEEFIGQIIVWSGKEHLSDTQKTGLLGKLFDYQRSARNMARVARSPVTVALFGPSQCGKSYLLNELVRGNSEGVEIMLGSSETADFLTKINPPGGRESTAQVTRFTSVARKPPHEAFPVLIRLLSPTDIVKILANGFAYECKIQEEAVLRSLEEPPQPRSSTSKEDSWLTPGDIFDIQEYVATHLDHGYFARLDGSGYWDKLRSLMEYAGPKSQMDHLSLLWGRIDSLTKLCAKFLRNLRQINSEEVWVEKGCLTPREGSIIDVQNLRSNLREGKDAKVQFLARGNEVGKIRKSRIAALTSELVLTVARPDESTLANQADILDFPGARARGNAFTAEQLDVPPDDPEEPDLLCEVFLRGKIAYLFERYIELRDINNLLLCLPPGDIEALSLPPLIKNWIHQTHGASHVERDGKPTTLYAVFTKFDQTLVESAGQPANSAARWESRLKNGFGDFFGRAYGKDKQENGVWTEKWDRQGPFRSCFWVRNPKVKSGVFQTDPQSSVETYVGRYETWIHELKRHYLNNPEVRRHFPNPELSWQEVAMPGRTGIALLLSDLQQTVRPERKREQLHLQMDRLYEDIQRLVRPYVLNANDVEAARKLARDHIAELAESLRTKGAFGVTLERFGITEKLAADLYERITKENPFAAGELQAAPSSEPDPGGEEMEWGTAISGLDSVIENVSSGKEPAEDTLSREEKDLARFGHRAASFSALVLNTWESKMAELERDEDFLNLTGLSAEWCREVRNQLVRAAERRYRLRFKIAESSSGAFLSPDPMRRQKEQAFLTALIVNNFVSYLGEPPFSVPEFHSSAPRASGKVFPGQKYFEAWTRKLEQIYAENSGVTDEIDKTLRASKEIQRILDTYRDVLE